MGSRLNIIAATLFIIWVVEFFGYNAGQNIHILLLVSIVIVLTKVSMLLNKMHEADFAKNELQ
ncbi:MAG: lmo0937 family membrane protein [Bacteroidota bacterium]